MLFSRLFSKSEASTLTLEGLEDYSFWKYITKSEVLIFGKIMLKYERWSWLHLFIVDREDRNPVCCCII